MQDAGSRERKTTDTLIENIILVDDANSAQSLPCIPSPASCILLSETPRLGQIKGGESTQAFGASFWLGGGATSQPPANECAIKNAQARCSQAEKSTLALVGIRLAWAKVADRTLTFKTF
jgi:hypothetical protein